MGTFQVKSSLSSMSPSSSFRNQEFRVSKSCLPDLPTAPDSAGTLETPKWYQTNFSAESQESMSTAEELYQFRMVLVFK